MLFVRLNEMETDGVSSCQQDDKISDEIYRHREELESLRQQMNSESEALRHLQTEYDSAEREMEELLEAIEKHHELLDSLDSQLDSDITARRRDIEVQMFIIDNLCQLVCICSSVFIFCLLFLEYALQFI